MVFFRDKILAHIDDASRNEYDDRMLAEMMLVDAYLIQYVLDITLGEDYAKKAILNRALGGTGLKFIVRDMYVLDNQIPYWILEFTENLNSGNNGEPQVTRMSIHLLESLRADLLTGRTASITNGNFDKPNRPFRSVMDLKTKGVRFCPSSNCLKDVIFRSSYFYGELQLPTPLITDDLKTLLSNCIALEMSPGVSSDLAVMSYVIFMKSLLICPRDVQELREAGALFSTLGSDEEVVQMFKDNNTFGLNYTEYFHQVKIEIEKHCSSKAKTWMAELIHNYFRSPWTVIALLAAIFLQTYYTIRSSA